MPLPVAHALVGTSVAIALIEPSRSRLWKTVLIAALLGISPDFDYALNWLRVSGGGWHHGFTHSILFALIVGLLIGSVIGAKNKLRSVLIFTGAIVSHTLLDFIMTESRGVALWWPFTDHRYKLRLPNPIDYTWSSASVWETAGDLLRISLTELIMFAPLLAVVMLVKRLWCAHGAQQIVGASDGSTKE